MIDKGVTKQTKKETKQTQAQRNAAIFAPKNETQSQRIFNSQTRSGAQGTAKSAYTSLPDFTDAKIAAVQGINSAAMTADQRYKEVNAAKQNVQSVFTGGAGIYERLMNVQELAKTDKSTGTKAMLQTLQRNYDNYTKSVELAAQAARDAEQNYADAYKKYQTARDGYDAVLKVEEAGMETWRKSIRQNYDQISLEIINQQQAVKDAQKAKQKADSALAEISARRSSMLDGAMVFPGEEEAAKKTAQDANNALQEAQKKLGLLQEERAYSRYFAYDKKQGLPDFAEKSQYKTTATGTKKFNALAGVYTDSGFGDILYDYINGNEEARTRQDTNSIANNTALMGFDKSFLREMTQDEVSTYNYVYATEGKDAAERYIGFLTTERNLIREGVKRMKGEDNGGLTQRQTEKLAEKINNFAMEHPKLATAAAIAESPLKGLSYLGQTADYLGRGKIDQYAGYNKFARVHNDLVSGAAQRIAENLEANHIDSKGTVWAYQLAVSMAEFLLNSFLSGAGVAGKIGDELAMKAAEAISLTIMGTGAAADSVIEAKERGLDDNQAYAIGTIAGTAEALTELVSIEALFGQAWDESLGKFLVKNIAAEGSEEIASDAINLTADILIAKDKSEWAALVDKYTKETGDPNKAFGKAVGDTVLNMMLSGLGGAISGGVMAGFTGLQGKMMQELYESIEQKNIQRQADAIADMAENMPTIQQEAVQSAQEAVQSAQETNQQEVVKPKQQESVAEETTKPKQETVADTREEGVLYGSEERLAELAGEQLSGNSEQVQQSGNSEQLEQSGNSGKLNQQQTEQQTAQQTQTEAKQTAQQTQKATETIKSDNAQEIAKQAQREALSLEDSASKYNVDAKMVEAAKRFQEQTGRAISYFRAKPGKSGTVDGFYDRNTNTIFINASSNMQQAVVFGHELTHSIEKSNIYKAFSDLVFKRMGEMGQDVEALRQDIRDLYAENGVSYANEADLIDKEIVAKFVQDNLLTNEAEIRALVESNRTTAQRIANWIDRMLAKFGNKDAKERAFLQKAREMYAQALEETKPQEKNEQAISEQADKAFSEATEDEKKRKVNDLIEQQLSQMSVSESKKSKRIRENAERHRAVNEELEEMGIIVDDATDSVDIQMFISDVLDDKKRAERAQKIADRTGEDQEKVEGWLKAETSIASLVTNPKYRAWLDYEPDGNENAIKKNSDYPQGSVDFSNCCPKRTEFSEVMNRVFRQFPNHVFKATDLAVIRKIMGEEGLTVPCGLCYVEDTRQLDSQVAQGFIDALESYRNGGRNKPDGTPFNANQLKGLALAAKDSYTPSIYELASLEGRNKLIKDGHKDIAQGWVKFNNARGMQRVRLLTNEAEYKRQIARYNKKTVAAKNRQGGLRIFSFSDAQMFHFLDIVQIVIDASSVGLNMQGYTKVAEFAKAFRNTGLKINRSLIPKGDLGYHMEGDQVVLDFDSVEGIDTNHPDFFDSSNNPNVGNTLVGINDIHIRAAMKSDMVDQIIPFHTGQSKEVREIKGTGKWENYKNDQTEKDMETGTVAKKQVNFYTDVLQVLEQEGVKITKKSFVEKFLEVCKERNLVPRFARFLDVDQEGNYVYTEGYHKFLVDYKMFSPSGRYLPQTAVMPKFDNAYISKCLKEYCNTQQKKDEAFAANGAKAIARIEKEVIGGTQFSISQDEYSGMSYDELEEEKRSLYQQERELTARQRTAASDIELMKAQEALLDFTYKSREAAQKKRAGTASEDEIAFLENRKEKRAALHKRVEEAEERIGIRGINDELYRVQDQIRAVRKASDAAWEREGAAKENAAIEKSGMNSADYFRKKAMKEFKATTNFNEAGYLLPDGKMLNFSGGQRGRRTQDHREIGSIYEATRGTQALNRFLADGNVRIMAESPGIDVFTGMEPTAKQYAEIRRFVNSHGSDGFYIDFSDAEGNRKGTYAYDGRASADRVINDIKYFYQNGTPREMSSVAEFHSQFSISDSEYTELAKDPEKNEAQLQKAVDEAARAAGYDTSTPLYHGTGAFGFKAFDLKRMDDKISIFTTSAMDLARSYANGGDVRKIGGIEDRIKKAAEIAETFREEIKTMNDQELIRTAYKRGFYAHGFSTSLAKINNAYRTNWRARAGAITDDLKSGIEVGMYMAAERGIESIDREQNAAEAIDALEEMRKATTIAEVEKAAEHFRLIADENKYIYEYLNSVYSTAGIGEIAIERLENFLKKIIKSEYDGCFVTETIGYAGSWDDILVETREELEDRLTDTLFYYNARISVNDGIYKMYGKRGNNAVIDNHGRQWSEIDGEMIGQPGKTVTTRAVAKWAKGKGYDSVTIKGVIDSGARGNAGARRPQEVTIFFNPKDLKSADPVTYDDEGRVIPPSERFSRDTDDLRYAISEDEKMQQDWDKAVRDRREIAVMTGELAQAQEDLANDMAEAFQKQTDRTIGETMERTGNFPQKPAPKRTQKEEARSFIARKFIDSGDAVSKMGKKAGDKTLYNYYSQARRSSAAAYSMINKAQTNIRGERVGDSLQAIFDGIKEQWGEEYYKQLELLLLHRHNINRMSREKPMELKAAREEFRAFTEVNYELAAYAEYEIERMAREPDSYYHHEAQEYMELRDNMRKLENTRNKAVFNWDVTAQISNMVCQTLEERLRQVNERFEDDAQKIYKYIDNLMQYRIDSGLMTEQDYEELKKIYPNYVPVYRMVNQSEQDTRERRKIQIGKTVGRAVGGEESIMSLGKALEKQTFSVVREGSKNRWGTMLLDRRYARSEEILGVESQKREFHEDTFDELEDPTPKRNNTFTVRNSGEVVDITVSKELFEAVNALAPERVEENALTKVLRASNDLFKKLCTGWNPAFMVKNIVRDTQDALLYSKHPIEWMKNLGLAYGQILKDGKYWQQYQALGGAYSGLVEFQNPLDRKAPNALQKIGNKIEAFSQATEQASRLAEFMAVCKSYKSERLTMDQLMEAIEASAEVTVNFGRSGTWGKVLNSFVVPFWNPGIQGLDKAWRTFSPIEKRTQNEWMQLAVKCAILGILPGVINAALWGDDDEYEDIKERDKDTNYLFRIRDGMWLKLPRGRVISLMQSGTRRAINMAMGKEKPWEDFWKTGVEQVAPANPLEQNLFAAWIEADLFDRESPGKTWYGGNIESQRLQGYAPGERYDASTDAISKAIGKVTGLSPKKINYILDQYTGVAGDILLPMLSQKGARGFFEKSFIVDTATQNRLANDFYRKSDELKYAKNSGKATELDEILNKFWSKQSSQISDINKAIRKIEEDPTTSKSDKEALSRIEMQARNAAEKTALETLDEYRKAAEKYLKQSKLTKPEDRIEEAYREANREVMGADYAIRTYNKQVYDKACDIRDRTGITMDQFYDFYFPFKAIEGKGYEKSNAERDLIASLNLSEKQKIALYQEYVSQSRDDDIQAFADAGMKFKTFVAAQNAYSEINANGGTAGQKRTEFARWAYGQKLTDEQRDVVMDSFTFYSNIPADTGKYEDFRGAGMDDKTSYAISKALTDLKPIDGKKQVSEVQKMEAITQQKISTEDQIKAISVVASESTVRKIKVASEHYVEPKMYADVWKRLPEFDADGNGSYKNDEIKAAIDAMGDYWKGTGTMDNAQKAVMWQLLTGNKSAKNNPYSRAIGQEVLDAINALKTAAAEEEE